MKLTITQLAPSFAVAVTLPADTAVISLSITMGTATTLSVAVPGMLPLVVAVPGSISGPVGPVGPHGIEGEEGPSGAPGIAGRDGQGIQGVAGAVGPPGVQGVQGVQGEPGPDRSSFVFTQATPLAVWVITHSLGRYPSIQVIDSSGRVVDGDIVYTSVNQIVVSFQAAFSGLAYVN